MNDSQNIDAILSKLGSTLPGRRAQYKMAPHMREHPDHLENYKDAAVLILLYPKNEVLHTAFIKRNEYDGVHSGQISLPGGMIEKQDCDLSATALRETQEEIGVDDTDIEIIGKLTPLAIPVSKFLVHPYIGYLNYLPEFNPDKNEVQYLILPKLSDFQECKNLKKGKIKGLDYEIESPYYHIENEVIWGATAMMMSEFMELIDY